MQLVIDTYGTALKLKAGKIEVIHSKGIQAFAPNKLSAIVLQAGVSITTDVLLAAVANEIDVLIMSGGNGQPEARIWSHKYGSISTIRKQQLRMADTPWASRQVQAWAHEKVQNQLRLLQALQRDRPAKQAALQVAATRVQIALDKLETLQPTDPLLQLATDIRTAEAQAGRAYFGALAQVVPQQYYFQGRSRRPAKDKFNSVLNYLYGMLYGICEGALIRAGLDPYVGFMHRDEYNRPSLVYDFIEPYRTWADEVALKLAFGRLLEEEFFSINPTDGGHWLETPGRRVVILAMNDYLEEVVQRQQKRRSRRQHVLEDAVQLAQTLKATQDHEPPPAQAF
jgi:CRISPR-associated protein Cas1